MLTSALLFAGMGAAVKAAAEQLPNSQVVFLRNLLGLIALLPWLLHARSRAWNTARPLGHLVRGLAGLAAMSCFFFAIRHMPLAEAVLLNYSAPLFMPLIERVWLGEPIPRRLWRGLALGFGGIVLILKPGLALFQAAALVGLCAAVFGAIAQVGIRRLTSTEPSVRIVCYFGVIASVVSAAPAAVVWEQPGPTLWVVLIVMGALATGGQLFLTAAYAQAPAGQVGPFVYSIVVFSGALDYVLWGHLPDRLSGVGAVLVVAAGVLTLRALDSRSSPQASRKALTSDRS